MAMRLTRNTFGTFWKSLMPSKGFCLLCPNPISPFLQQKKRTSMMKMVLKRTLVLLITGVLGMGAPQAFASAAYGPVPFNTIIIGWDGVQRDHFWECYNQELAECPDGLPNIKRLSGGVIYGNTTTNGKTFTKPGWAQILSGYNWQITGVYSNKEFQPIPKDLTIFEKLENHFGKDNIVTLFVAGMDNPVGGDCWPGGGEPFCITKSSLDFFQTGLGENNNVGTKAIELLSMYKGERFFAFIHFKSPDKAGHDYGENSAQYTEKIIDDDQWLGRIVDKLEEWDIDDETYVYVTTDHGFDEGLDTHRNAPFGFLAANDPYLTRPGDRKDIAPTILKRYGISLEQQGSIPAVDGYPLDTIPDIRCIPKGEAYIDYAGAPQCCDGLVVVGLDRQTVRYCFPATGGTGDHSGYCTKCGDGKCQKPENRCNCPADCSTTLADVTGSNSLDDRPLVGRRIILTQPEETKQITKTDSNGRYDFGGLVSGKRFKVTIKGPTVPSAGAVISGEVSLKGDPVVGRIVILKQPSEPNVRTKTDSDGSYLFSDMVGDKTFKIIIKGPEVP